MKKRILSFALALLLCLGLAAPAGAYGDMGRVGEYNIITSGTSHVALIDKNGTLWTWGGNAKGQLGIGMLGDELGLDRPRKPAKVMTDVISASCGEKHTAAIKSDGSLWMWGDNFSHQLGIEKENYPGRNAQTVPAKVLDNVAAVSCGRDYTAAIKTDGTLWMWGDNYYGQLGFDSQSVSSAPVKVMDNVAAVSCGRYHTAAIKTDGTLWMWGANSVGQVGDGSTTVKSTTPVKVMDNVAAVSCGRNHTAAVKTDGTLWVWGLNDNGQLGLGSKKTNTTGNQDTHDFRPNPVQVLDDATAVNCGYNSTAAIKTDGTLWLWGMDGLSGGGLGTRVYPEKILDDVVAVSLQSQGGIITKGDGTLWGWGGNNFTYTANIYVTMGYQITQMYLEDSISLSKGVRIYLNGGIGGGTLWTDATGTIKVPTNPTRSGYTFAGWYTDVALTIPWNFNNEVVNSLALYAKWTPVSSTAATTGKSSQIISLNGNTIALDAYTLIAPNGGDVTYVKLRDIAALLENTDVKFNVDWRNGAIYVTTKTAYTTKNGTELKSITGANGSYRWNTAPVLFDGTTKALEGIVITDGNGGDHTFFKLRDLGSALGFTVGWSAETGIYIETK